MTPYRVCLNRSPTGHMILVCSRSSSFLTSPCNHLTPEACGLFNCIIILFFQNYRYFLAAITLSSPSKNVAIAVTSINWKDCTLLFNACVFLLKDDFLIEQIRLFSLVFFHYSPLLLFPETHLMPLSIQNYNKIYNSSQPLCVLYVLMWLWATAWKMLWVKTY